MRRTGAILSMIAAVAMAGLSVGGQFWLRSMRAGSAPVMAEGAIAMLGGLRSIIAEVVWFRADRLQEEGRYVELAQLASTLAFLEPHTPEVWSYAAWNLAYNVSIMMPTPDDRWRWVLAAIRLLRDEGLRLNPRESELYRELAWLFELKLGADLDAASPVYRARWGEIMADVVSRGAWDEVGMDQRFVEYVSRACGISDWTDPQASAIYWALLGLDRGAAKEDRQFLNEIIRQAKRMYDRSHE